MAGELAMAERADYLAELRFTGGIYDSCALDERALREIVKVMQAISETARELWRADNPNRTRMPKRFSESNQVHLREIRSGSTGVLLGHAVRADSQLLLMRPTLDRAVSFMRDSCVAVRNGSEPPQGLTPALVKTYAALGATLDSSAALSFAPPDGAQTNIDPLLRKRFRERIPDSYEGIVDLIGRVLAADVHRRTFQIWLGQTEHVNADFSGDQESIITSALHDHEVVQLHIRGHGRYQMTGELLHIDRVDQIGLLDPDNTTFDPSEPSLSEMVERAFANVPDEVWESLPRDLAERHDDYFSGAATY